MSIGCTRLLWLNKSSKCTRLAYKPPDYGRTTRPLAHTHTRTRSGRELAPRRHEAGHCLLFRLGALFPELFLNLFPELFFVDHEVAVSTPTHKAQKRIHADGLDIGRRLPVGTATAREGLRIQMLLSKWHREICSWRGGPEKCIATTCHITPRGII